METLIYGPRGEIARRVVRQTGQTASAVYDDPDGGRMLVHRVFDAEPAMKEAKAIRDTGRKATASGLLRHAGVLPFDVFAALQRDAQIEVRRVNGTPQDVQDVLSRKVKEYWEENPVFKT